MNNHIYMVYDDSSPESTRDADITHKTLLDQGCLLYTSPSPRDMRRTRMPSSA